MAKTISVRIGTQEKNTRYTVVADNKWHRGNNIFVFRASEPISPADKVFTGTRNNCRMTAVAVGTPEDLGKSSAWDHTEWAEMPARRDRRIKWLVEVLKLHSPELEACDKLTLVKFYFN